MYGELSVVSIIRKAYLHRDISIATYESASTEIFRSPLEGSQLRNYFDPKTTSRDGKMRPTQFEKPWSYKRKKRGLKVHVGGLVIRIIPN